MPRPSSPPDAEFLRRDRRSPGDRTVRLELGGLALELSGLDDDLQARLLNRYSVYARAGLAESPSMRLSVFADETDYFITPPAVPEPNPVLLALDGDALHYLGYRMAARLEFSARRGVAVLARGTYEPPERAFENLVRVNVAWLAALRGGALVHAASAVHDDRGWFFYGQTGSGKSLMAEKARRGRFVSDDLSLFLPAPDGSLRLIGSPFRGTYAGGAPVVGDFPVAAGFRLLHGDEARVVDVPRPLAFSGLIANLPFVAEFFNVRADLYRDVVEAFQATPLAHLFFRPDDSFWDAVEGWWSRRRTA